MDIFGWLLGGRPMEYLGFDFTDAVTGESVNRYRDRFGRTWLANHPWSGFRVAVSDTENDGASMAQPTFPDSSRTAAQRWARAIRAGSTATGIDAAVQALNCEIRSAHLTRADVIVACAQLLGQSVANAGPDCAAEMRAGILAMVDGYTMQTAVELEP